MLTVGSLFSGIGGFDLGLERAGMEIIWQVENDPYCRKVLAKHWPDVPCYEDVHDVGAHNLAEVDVICGGFPCQPVSVVGKQRGQDDERWLWPEFARVLRELRPRYVLVENVPGLLIRGMGDVLGDLAEIGYDAEWGCISAASVGAPHLRKRVFVIGHTHGHHDDTLAGVSQGTRSDTSGSGDVAHATGAGAGPNNEGIWQRSSRISGGHGTSRAEGGHWATGGGSGKDVVAHAQSGGYRWRTRKERRTQQRQVQEKEQRGNRLGSKTEFCGLLHGGTGEGDDAGNWWAVEPSVGRVVDGLPNRVDRLRGLGNAIVPQVAEWIGRRLMAMSRIPSEGETL